MTLVMFIWNMDSFKIIFVKKLLNMKIVFLKDTFWPNFG